MIIKNFSPYSVVKEALANLKSNEKKVVSGRFGIDEERKTLSAIGKELKLSRERIRQIERDAMKKLSVYIVEENSSYVDKIIASFEKNGGISNHLQLADKFLDQQVKDDKNEFNSLNLIFCLTPQIKKIEKTRDLEEGWILSTLSRDDVVNVVTDWVKHLEKVKKPLSIEVLVKNNPHQSKYEMTFLSELPLISKKIIKNEAGKVGLVSWPEVNPRNVRDKIYYILKEAGKPLHFNTISENINEKKFGKKKVVRATVHNELIADDRFVLVGRGIYALSEWGYRPGTVRDIILEILKKSGKAMTSEEIVAAVMKQRTVKKNTILINLQTKKDFVKAGKNLFTIKV